jgi:hypothetical protein
MSFDLTFDPTRGETKTLTLDGATAEYRAFTGIVYVAEPVDLEYQTLNLFVPEAYYRGESIHGYTAETAPIFLPNTVGGYMPGKADEPGIDFLGRVNATFYALCHGYVVASPGLRGRTLQDADGRFTGKAPACIVDYKAAVRYLRRNRGRFPGDVDKLVSNGTSAGGALSSLLGATGDSADYTPYLSAIGAAEESDRIFASSCFCPIINLDHADMAYEWLFEGVNDYAANRISMENGKPVFTPVSGTLTEEELQLSAKARADFAPYLAGLGLRTPDGKPLDETALRAQLKALIVQSAQRALDQGQALDEFAWVKIEDGVVRDVDYDAYLHHYKRMKTPLPFDSATLSSPENDLFGSETVACRCFTPLAASLGGVEMADPMVIRMMNPMNYVGEAATAQHWRIRHGAADRDTSLVIPLLFATLLQNRGYSVDFASPWGIPHSGDYELNDLFAWIDGICQ